MSVLLPFLLACNFYGGDVHSTKGVVLEAGGASVVLEHEGIEGLLPPGQAPFTVDPNLSRKVEVGDVVHANVMVTPDDMRAIGFKVVGHQSASRPRIVDIGQPFPSVTLPSTQGEVVVGVGQQGPVVLTFLFTSCPLPAFCPLLAFKLGKLQPQIAGKAHIIAVTLDPAKDSLAVLQTYGVEKGADPTVWSFARLEPEQLQALLLHSGVSVEQQEADILHNLRTLLIDQDGVLVWSASDNEWEPDELAQKIQGL